MMLIFFPEKYLLIVSSAMTDYDYVFFFCLQREIFLHTIVCLCMDDGCARSSLWALL